MTELCSFKDSFLSFFSCLFLPCFVSLKLVAFLRKLKRRQMEQIKNSKLIVNAESPMSVSFSSPSL